MNKLNFGVRLPDQALPEKVARIRLGEVFFETDSELIKPANQPMLTKIANAIRHYRCGVISITGHTDDTGRADYNLKLGQRRADSVRRALGKLLDKSLMEQVDILVAPPPEQRSSLETLSTAAGRLLAGLVDMLVPVAHAEEHADCVSTACAEDSGVVIDIVSRGELEPRSSNATTQGRADNRRADVVFNGRLQLRDGGTVWATEDPAIIEPRLSVSGPAFISHSEGRFTQPAVFRLYSNYSHFIERWELGVYDASDTDLIVPLKTFSGNRLAYETGVEWNGETDRGRPLRAGDELVYMLRVFDADGRFDETAVASLYLGDPVAGDAAASTGLDETLNGYGESTLVRQTIPLSGSRVRIHGSDVPAAYTLSIDGEVVPVDSHGAFAVERILPTGEYPVDVAITDARNESWHRQLDVKVTGGYLFMVGIADLTVGENDFSGSDKALSDEGDEDGSVSDGRLAFYMKGKFAGKYRVTAQVDTTEEELGDVFSDLDRKDPDSVFRRLDPDRYYPTFGDDSTTTSDVDTQGRFYGRVEWDKSQALWGNFNTGITGNEYAQYDRSLYGGRMQYRDVDITRFGDHETELTVFGSEPNTAFAHNEFSGTGGSLYYLRNTDIVQGSEKVWVEVRERDTNRVLENITLQHGSDYQVDDIQGRIILNRPLAQVSSSAAPSIIKDQPLDGNDMLLMVDYEYVPDEFDSDRMTYGVRGKDWLTDRLGLGGTYVHEDRDGTNYELKGADVTLRHGAGTYIKAEYARSDARQTAADFASDDGGLSFSALNDSTDESVSGDAIKLEARVNHAEVTQGRAEGLSAVWWKHRDKGFSVARVDDGIDTTEYGAESSWQATENLALAVRGAVIDKEDDMEDRSLSAQADYRTNGPWTLSGELRYVSEDPDGESSRDATLAGAGVDYALAPGTSVYSTVQTAVSRDSDYAANNLYTLGVKARVGKRVTLNAEGSTGNRGEALQLGADYKVGSDYSMYTSYILSTDRSGGRKGVAVFGQRRQVGNSLRVFTEKQFSSGDEQSGLSSVYGLDFTPAKEWTLSALFQSSNPDDDDDGLERNAVSLGARYQGERLDFSNRLEYRRDRGDEDETQWLTANNLRFLINEEWTGVGKLNFSYSDNHDTGRDDGRFAEFDAGLAYRPVHHDRLNILSKYTYLYDLDSAGQQDAGTDQRSHVVSLEGIYDLNQRWELGSKLAWKRGEEREGRDEGRWFRTEKRLVVVRGRYHLTRHWDGLLEYRWLDVDEADDNRQGALLGIDRHINDHLKIGLGYNFTDFSDDLTDLDYQNNGWFLNFVGKL
ncbi:MAG: OmpA family protein [Gammaproteobacteria bacterium]|nr:OmpA family protein [Gammaproteobacteria bacterium]